ncbi:MAG: hypothetical protein AB8G99_03090 [Planctomycetaceae bacterium]
MKHWNIPPIILISAGAIVTLATAFFGGQSGATLAGCAVGAVLPLASIPFLKKSANSEADVFEDAKMLFENERNEFEKQRAGIEDWRDSIRSQLDQQVHRIEDRERSLAEKLATHQELFELPNPSQPPISFERNERLTVQDRQVLELLQTEAEVAYEKIRNKEYSTADGKVDIQLVREDIHSLVQRVAKVYSPNSENPLLETSFENVARAAGRVCLHALVLVEQLPLDVKQYNFNNMYSYIRKAVVAYGQYQKSAPWFSYLSRSLYAGRFLAGANPLTLGAWVVATEVGKKAGQKAVENFVDRQAIGLLHDLIRVIGFEVANIYGGDFRHRDPNWIYGSELTELVGRFPLSRESLREGLRQVSSLPLRNEYDRVYLYRCIADHRAAGLTLSDPALLTREEREQIASGLEKFFTDFVHGATDKEVTKWKSEFEERFDMRLNLNSSDERTTVDRTSDCVQSIVAFLQSVVGLESKELKACMQRSQLMQNLTEDAQLAILSSPNVGFEPADIDPSESIVDEYLNDLVRVTVATKRSDENIERLVAETGAYFRRTIPEMTDRIDAAYVELATESFVENAPTRKLPTELARELLQTESVPQFAYTDVTWSTGDKPVAVEGVWLVGLKGADTKLVAFQLRGSIRPIWKATRPTASRD